MSIDFISPPPVNPETYVDLSEFEADISAAQQTENLQNSPDTEQRLRNIGHTVINRARDGYSSVTMTFGNVTLTQPGRVPGANLKK